MKYADKTGARYTCVIGDDELSAGVYKVKNMADGGTFEIPAADFAEKFSDVMIKEQTKLLGEQLGLGEDLGDIDLSALLKG